jgi:hypothetical protein
VELFTLCWEHTLPALSIQEETLMDRSELNKKAWFKFVEDILEDSYYKMAVFSLKTDSEINKMFLDYVHARLSFIDESYEARCLAIKKQLEFEDEILIAFENHCDKESEQFWLNYSYEDKKKRALNLQSLNARWYSDTRERFKKIPELPSEAYELLRSLCIGRRKSKTLQSEKFKASANLLAKYDLVSTEQGPSSRELYVKVNAIGKYYYQLKSRNEI